MARVRLGLSFPSTNHATDTKEYGFSIVLPRAFCSREFTETSKRANLHQRARIKDKARETRKKRKRDAKKNPQWKSSTSRILLHNLGSAEVFSFDPEKAKDPGIPANFPYKDQILAEIAEQRRQAAEAKEKRKEEKQAARIAAAEVDGETQPTAGPSTATIKNGVIQPAVSDDEDAPILLNPEYPHFQAIFEKSDVILHVLDARDPLPFRSSQIESLVDNKPEQRLVFVLNKAGM